MWNQKEYLASEIFDLTDEEKREVNQKMINEIEEENKTKRYSKKSERFLFC